VFLVDVVECPKCKGRMKILRAYKHLPLVVERAKFVQRQRPPAMQRPWMEEINELSLQVWSMPTVQIEPGPTQPIPGMKQAVLGQAQ
jgi:hypothetical protein